MWFLSARNARRTPSASPKRGAFRPRLEALEDRCLLSAGALDITFTGPSSQASYTALPASPVGAVLVQADGKIVTGGYLTTANGSGSISDFALVRYNANGSLDTTFGNNGVVQTVVGVNNSYINGLAIDARGNIVAVGQAVNLVKIKKTNHYDPAFAIARYLPTGALDTTFGSGGIVLTNVESDQQYSKTVGAFAVALDGSGNIDVAGTANPSSTLNTGDVFALARYTANGTLDTTFGTSGLVVTPQFANQPDQAFALTIQSDKNIVVAGTTGNPVGSNTTSWAMAVARYTSTGGLDPNFGVSGIVTGLAPSGYHTRAHAILVQSSGDIVVAGNSFASDISTNPSHEYQTLARLNSSGGVDTSFGGAGTGYAINTNLYGALALAQAANGDLLAASATLLNVSGAPNKFGVAAFLPGGTPDTTFGTGGTTTAQFSGGISYDTAMAIQGDGKIVAAGDILPSGSSTFTIALARFLPPNTSTIGSFIGSSTGGNVSLTASSITNYNPTIAISQVNFYVQNSNLTLTLVGTATNNGSGTYTITFLESTYSLTPLTTYTFVAQAVDSNGDLSDPLAISFQVM